MATKILLVDDEEGIRKVLGITLTDIGYEVLSAKNGEEALKLFRKAEPPIVLTDIKMPGIDGVELLKKIKEEAPNTEVIMITGHGDMGLAIKSLKFDATDFITKPIHEDALEIALKRAHEKIFFKTKLREYTENLEKLVEEKTNQLMKTELLAAVGQTVAGLAHAIKNITGGLTGGMFVLKKGIELENKKYLSQGWEMVERNVNKIKQMATDLLNYAKEREPEYRRYDPNGLLREIFDLSLPRAREQGISLEMDLDKSLSHVCFDPEGIHRCLLNLVSNAIDACTDTAFSKKPANVILRSLNTEGWAVEYQIVDNGCGMDKKTVAKIFQGFFSTKGTRGTGLGLMITKKIITEHGGDIHLESEKEKGTTFFIRLPERSQPPELSADQFQD